MARACRWPGCPALLPASGYCPRHAARGAALDVERSAAAARPRRRTDADRLRSSAAWQRLRAEVRRDEPVCQRCRREFSAEVHHVVPVDVDPGRSLDRANLRALCRACHEVEEREIARGRTTYRVDTAGGYGL